MRHTRHLILVAAAISLLAILAPPSGAQAGVQITTPYPAVVVGPGESPVFDLDISAPSGQRVNLAVTRRPRGWPVTLRGGGFVIQGVTGGGSRAVQLDVDVPADAGAGLYRIDVRASSSSGSDVLAIDIRVQGGGGGGVELTTDFQVQQGTPDTIFNFDVQLANNTPQEVTFSMGTSGPPGWQLTARPAGQQQAVTLTVPGGGSSSITVEADPPDDATSGPYPLLLQVAGGGQQAELELEVQITGNFALTLTTPDERLNAEATAGSPSEVALVVRNDGTAPVNAVTLTSSPPADWEVAFRPENIDLIQPGQSVRVMATITPAAEAIAGDYLLTLTASADGGSDEIELRTTVKTSGLWGVVGILLIAAAVAGLWWVFQRYGRR
jgi:uncharacterized membrane protein